MNLFSIPSPDHHDDDHPENAKRIPAILNAITNDATLQSLTSNLQSSPASDDQIALIHDPAYIHSLRDVMKRAPAYIDHAPTYVTPQSFDCAAAAAGAAIAATSTSISNPQSPISFALIRP
ncbi:MAG: hypothetical protein AAB571_02640, partial [Chloroflexota bacterium]